MANIGLNNFWYAKEGTTEGIYAAPPALLGDAIEAKCSIESRSGELYAEDGLADSIDEVKSAKLTLTVADDDDTKFAGLLGNSTAELTTPATATEVVQKSADEPPFVGIGHIIIKRINKVTKYKTEFFPKVKFQPFVTDAKTKGSSIDFGTPEVEGTVYTLADGTWERHATFDTAANALTYLKSLMPTTGA